MAETGDPGAARRARLCVLAAAVLWSTSGALIKQTVLDAWQISTGRAVIAAAVIALLLPASRRGWTRRTWLVGLAYVAVCVSFVSANKLTTSANAIFLQDAAPLWVLLLSAWLLRERPTRSELLLAPFYLAGSALFFLDERPAGTASALGDGLAIGSGCAFAALIVGLRSMRAGGAEAAVLCGNLLTVVACAPLSFRGPAPTARDVEVVSFLGVFQLGLSYVFFVRGLRGVSALEGSLLALFEPVLNPIWAYVIIGEKPGPWAIAGGALILSASLARILLGGAPPEAAGSTTAAASSPSEKPIASR